MLHSGREAADRSVLFLRCLVAALFAALSWQAAAETAQLPVKTFFQNDDVGDVRLSPSGRRLAIKLTGSSSRVILGVVDVADMNNPVIVAQFSRADIRSFEWAGDERIVFNVLDAQSGGGDQGFGPGLFSVKYDGTQLRELIRARNDFVVAATQQVSRQLDYTHRLLWVPAKGGEEVIIGERRWDSQWDLDFVNPKRLNVATGQSTSLGYGAPSHAMGWVFDPAGEPRVAIAYHQGQTEIFWRDAGASKWRSISKSSSVEPLMEPIAADEAGQLFVLTGSPKGTQVLKRFDFTANEPEREALISTPGFDFTGTFVYEPGTGRIVGVRVETDAEATVWFDAEMKSLQKRADARFPGRVNRLTCHRCQGDGALLVFSYSDQDPGAYWLYRASTDAWHLIGKSRSGIEPAQMAQTDLKRIVARDGQDLPVWITRPVAAAARPLPAVVLVHGGPWVRGSRWEWDADAQFLASRGYVVIQPEFRGSQGFGWQHFRSGWKQWGGTMQDDVADAVRWAATSGLVDPARVCIAGASYGGYATLMGLVRDPALYKCGVAWVAVTDPRLLFDASWASDIHKEARGFTLPQLMGDLRNDAELLKNAAPVERAAAIRSPVLLAFGGQDRRVPIEHGTRMRDALQSAGQSPEWILYPDEGHGWLKLENRVDFWERTEKFLRKHLH